MGFLTRSRTETTAPYASLRAVDAGTDHLDRLSWITRHQLVELVTGLHPVRHMLRGSG
ncbi:MAG: hypothetical protein ACRDTA_24750 [Pseudonocardiaceae bacterium]